MRRGRGIYSTLVSVLKIGLPLTAFGILAAVFLISPEDELAGGLTFQAADLAALGDGLQITNPQLSGQADDGTVYTFEAKTVTPRDASLQEAAVAVLDGDILLLDGRRLKVKASSADLNMNEQRMRFPEGISVTTSDGYQITAQEFDADLRAATFNGSGGIDASGPAGRITSDRMRIESTEPDGKNPVIWFESRVRVVIEPARGG